MTQKDIQHIGFLRGTLIPDLKDSGQHETAKDFEKLIKIAEAGEQNELITLALLLELKNFFEQVEISDTTAEDYKSLYVRIKIMIRAIQSPDILPTVMEYGELLKTICDLKDISDLEARSKYGQFNYSQWNKLLKP